MRRTRVRLGPHLMEQSGASHHLNFREFAKLASVLLTIAAVVVLWRAFASPEGAENLPTDQTVLGAQVIQPPPTDYYLYQVRSGDSIFSISERYKVRWQDIAQMNDLVEPYLLDAGSEVKLPISEITRSQQFYENLKNKIYVVERGDTFVSIAQKLNISITDLLRANPQMPSPDELRVGQVLNVP